MAYSFYIVALEGYHRVNYSRESGIKDLFVHWLASDIDDPHNIWHLAIDFVYTLDQRSQVIVALKQKAEAD